VTIHVTAPKIDPGFDATITLEMANFGKIPVELRAVLDEPVQLMFFRLSTPVPETDLYGTGANDTFQGQTDPIPRGATATRVTESNSTSDRATHPMGRQTYY
jgi:deoxycytidine triphosphate deaminase